MLDDVAARFWHRALVRFAGQDLGPPKDKAAIQRWRERFP